MGLQLDTYVVCEDPGHAARDPEFLLVAEVREGDVVLALEVEHRLVNCLDHHCVLSADSDRDPIRRVLGHTEEQDERSTDLAPLRVRGHPPQRPDRRYEIQLLQDARGLGDEAEGRPRLRVHGARGVEVSADGQDASNGGVDLPSNVGVGQGGVKFVSATRFPPGTGRAPLCWRTLSSDRAHWRSGTIPFQLEQVPGTVQTGPRRGAIVQSWW